MDSLAIGVEVCAALLTVSGVAYGVLALWGARGFMRGAQPQSAAAFAPGVTVLKPLKGADAQQYAAFASHCTQTYAGDWEIVFGVSTLEDAAVAHVAKLRVEYPQVTVRLVECPERLGSNGKVSTLAQLLPEARYEHIVINDADIVVPSTYLASVMLPFRAEGSGAEMGMVTVPYVGQAQATLWSRMEALGIATDFFPGVLTARMLEGGMRFGLGSTLATTKTVLARMGGLEALLEELADDYEMGARIVALGLRVELAHAVVATTVPAYTLRGFCEHQMRWARGVRDSRRAGYVGLGVTYVLPWALVAVVASGGALWSFTLLSLALLVRVAVALTVGVGILRDGQVLRDLWLLPLRDCCGLGFWVWSYASDVVVWRGERFRLRGGRLEKL